MIHSFSYSGHTDTRVSATKPQTQPTVLVCLSPEGCISSTFRAISSPLCQPTDFDLTITSLDFSCYHFHLYVVALTVIEIGVPPS